MHPIVAHLARLYTKAQTNFQPEIFALWSIHVVGIWQTLANHPSAWTELHMTVTISLVATALNWLKG